MSPNLRRIIDRPALFAGLAALVLSAGCSGGSSAPGAAVPPASSSSSKLGTAKFTIKVPAQAATQSLRAAPRYISSATTQMLIDVQQGGTSLSGFPQTIGLTPSSPNCTNADSGLYCTLAFNILPGAYTVNATAEDAAGHALSVAQSIGVTITAGVVNNVPLTLSGVPVSLELSTGSTFVTGTQAGGYTLIGPGNHLFYVSMLDADGEAIVGAGAPTITTSVSGALNVTVTGPTSGSPNTVNIAPPATFASGTGTVHFTASFGTGSTNACAATGANCTASVSFNENQLLAVEESGQSKIYLYQIGPNPAPLLATITNGLAQPSAMTFDKTGDLIVGNYEQGVVQNVVEYPPPYTGATSLTITGIYAPLALTVDSANNLYVGDYIGSASEIGVFEFAPGATTPSRTIPFSYPNGVTGPINLCTDASNNLYVNNGASAGGSLVMFPSGSSTTPTASVLGVQYSYSAICDSNGNYYVAQTIPSFGSGYTYLLSRYGPGLTGPTYMNGGTNVITHYTTAVDPANNFYLIGQVSGAPVVQRFAPGATNPNLTITGLAEPTQIAVDALGDVFTYDDGSINEYLSGSTSLYMSISQPFVASQLAVSP